MIPEEGFLGALYEAQVTDGLLCVRGLANLLHRRQEQSDEYGDNRDYHQQLYEREPTLSLLEACCLKRFVFEFLRRYNIELTRYHDHPPQNSTCSRPGNSGESIL